MSKTILINQKAGATVKLDASESLSGEKNVFGELHNGKRRSGFFALSPVGARAMAAALIELADRLDPPPSENFDNDDECSLAVKSLRLVCKRDSTTLYVRLKLEDGSTFLIPMTHGAHFETASVLLGKC